MPLTFSRNWGAATNSALEDEDTVARILELLEDPIPYHVQIFFSALRDVCQATLMPFQRNRSNGALPNGLRVPVEPPHLDHYAERLEITFDVHEHETARNILGRACRHLDGVNLADFRDLEQRDERSFRSVLRDLEADGYVRQEGDRLKFRSNLLREWWRRHHGRSIVS